MSDLEVRIARDRLKKIVSKWNFTGVERHLGIFRTQLKWRFGKNRLFTVSIFRYKRY